jgi:hypothetical protein
VIKGRCYDDRFGKVVQTNEGVRLWREFHNRSARRYVKSGRASRRSATYFADRRRDSTPLYTYFSHFFKKEQCAVVGLFGLALTGGGGLGEVSSVLCKAG